MNNLAFQIYGSTKSGIFQSTWKTDNAGVSSSTQIELPLLSGGTYNFWIDWGDGSTTNVTSYSQRTHTYASAGTYTIRATGTVGIWQFANGGDKLKILTISSLGKLILGSNTFNGCSNLTLSGVTDIPDLSTVNSLAGAFAGCSKITTIGRINEWNTSSVTNINNIFSFCSLFNDNIGSWNTSNVTSMIAVFNYCSTFDQCIGSWNVTNCITFEGMFYSCSNFNNGDNSVPLNNWVLNTTATSIGFGYTFINCVKFNRYLGGWNTSKVYNMDNLFTNCTIFNNGYVSGIANQLPWNTSACTNMSGMFQGAPAFNSNLGTGTTPWDVSKVTTFASMFNGATNFTNGDDSAPINNWSINTVSNVSMNSMFMGASIFNRDISNWNMTKVNHIGFMFNTATAFNQPVGNWERTGSTLGNVTNMRQTFRFTNFFNQDISNWNVNKVTDFGFMFNAAIAFNNGSNSNTNPVTSRTGIDGWDINTVSNVTMDSMFQSANAFNRPIDNWYMTKVTNINSMFRSSTFNHPLSNWERIGSTLGNVTDMGDMFASNIVFNQDIGNWNTSSVTTMLEMFFQATAFNQNIGSWNVSNVINFVNFMYLKTNLNFSSTNLDAIYNGWIVNGVKPNINISFGTAKYTAAGTAGRLTLTSAPNNWIITDGGL